MDDFGRVMRWKSRMRDPDHSVQRFCKWDGMRFGWMDACEFLCCHQKVGGGCEGGEDVAKEETGSGLVQTET